MAEILGQDPNEAGNFNPNSKNDTLAFSLALNSNDDDSPWTWGLGAGIQKVSMDVVDATILRGNIKSAAVVPNSADFMPSGLNRAQRIAWNAGEGDQETYLAYQAALTTYKNENLIDPNGSTNYTAESIHHQNEKHDWTLKTGNFNLQYTIPDTGFSIYGQAAYGQRAPTSTEMYMHGLYYRGTMGQARYLKPEENLSLQLGVNYKQYDFFTDDDFINLNLNFYRNKIDNYILMGYPGVDHTASLYNFGSSSSDETFGDLATQLGSMAYVNNTTSWITKGLGLDVYYRQPLFYIRGNLTVPFKKHNKVCYDEFAGGNGFYREMGTNSTVTIIEAGSGRNVCGNAYKWMSYQNIEPVQGSLTAAITPFDGKLELGTTLSGTTKILRLYHTIK